MDIQWYGHSCFRLRATEGVVMMDPYGKDAGLKPPRLRADIVTVSHDHPGHNHVAAAQGEPYIIRGPGEYEVRGVFVVGVRLGHDARGGGNLGFSNAFCVTAEDVTVCHLGDLGHRPTQAQVEALGQVDVLLVPVGGHNTIGAGLAAEVVNLIDPGYVIPMHYHSPGRPELEPVEKFLQEMGVTHASPQEVLKVAAGRLPEEPQVVLLELKQ
jgi:L-ascorbate metabolism protein UlaG (beta-lactamase superfamily)